MITITNLTTNCIIYVLIENIMKNRDLLLKRIINNYNFEFEMNRFVRILPNQTRILDNVNDICFITLIKQINNKNVIIYDREQYFSNNILYFINNELKEMNDFDIYCQNNHKMIQLQMKFIDDTHECKCNRCNKRIFYFGHYCIE